MASHISHIKKSRASRTGTRRCAENDQAGLIFLGYVLQGLLALGRPDEHGEVGGDGFEHHQDTEVRTKKPNTEENDGERIEVAE